MNLKHLREVADAATPGVWEATETVVWTTDVVADPSDETGQTAMQVQVKVADSDRLTATHIATFDPPTVLALLAEIERLSARRWSPVGDALVPNDYMSPDEVGALVDPLRDEIERLQTERDENPLVEMLRADEATRQRDRALANVLRTVADEMDPPPMPVLGGSTPPMPWTITNTTGDDA